MLVFDDNDVMVLDRVIGDGDRSSGHGRLCQDYLTFVRRRLALAARP